MSSVAPNQMGAADEDRDEMGLKLHDDQSPAGAL
jgi:hypothetical protein